MFITNLSSFSELCTRIMIHNLEIMNKEATLKPTSWNLEWYGRLLCLFKCLSK